MFRSILNLFYPKICLACEGSISDDEAILCAICIQNLPETYFHTYTNNTVEKIFYGRVKIYRAAALYYFEKGGDVQKLIYRFKYKGDKKIGVFLGELYANRIIQSDTFPLPDLIIPVPLHPKKLKRRGFNQSFWFAKGLSNKFNIPVLDNILTRESESESQTKKSRYARWKNVKNIFSITNKAAIENKHILLVDDTITTGATLEACIKELEKIPDIKVSILAIAYAK